jgi:ADP-ribose pyrophosphatase YjhB (NUDIX family)
MQFPVAVRRIFYRVAHCILRVFWFVLRPKQLGVKCVLTHDERILLVRHTYGRRCWDLPGGAVSRGEAPLHAAGREMREELGVKAAEWTDLGELRGRVHHRRDTIHCFGAELATPELTLDLGELAAARWFARTDLPGDLGPYVLPIMTRAPGLGTDPGR